MDLPTHSSLVAASTLPTSPLARTNNAERSIDFDDRYDEFFRRLEGELEDREDEGEGEEEEEEDEAEVQSMGVVEEGEGEEREANMVKGGRRRSGWID